MSESCGLECFPFGKPITKDRGTQKERNESRPRRGRFLVSTNCANEPKRCLAGIGRRVGLIAKSNEPNGPNSVGKNARTNPADPRRLARTLFHSMTSGYPRNFAKRTQSQCMPNVRVRESHQTRDDARCEPMPRISRGSPRWRFGLMLIPDPGERGSAGCVEESG
jgi:hypothetical protein